MRGGQILFVTGIDTNIGKTIATGLIAKGLLDAGVNVITQKGVQTGCIGQSEDIIIHRQLMGIGLLPEDEQGLTCQYLFKTPCSPHLAARLEGVRIETKKIQEAAHRLSLHYEVVLVEGAGGVFVPLDEEETIIDLLATTNWPVVLVTSSRLGSINHTLATLEALHARNIRVAAVVYNRFGETDQRIAEDSLAVIGRYLKLYGFACPIVEMGVDSSYHGPGSCRIFADLLLAD